MTPRRDFTTCTQYNPVSCRCCALTRLICRERECRFYTTDPIFIPQPKPPRTPEAAARHREAQRRMVEKWRANHRCVVCGGEIAEANLRTCRACRQYQSEKMTERRAARTAAGLCARCAAPLDARDEYVHCPECREKYRQSMRRYLKPKQTKEET